ncbi:MAG: hypothetical protein H6Q90_1383 [Deltaproteobacteria bacterium]|nr:hypothetical protein [Deltaproteobacteria bacterium]
MNALCRIGLLVAINLGLLVATRGSADAQPVVQTVDANISSALSLTIDTPFSPNPWILTIPANPNTNASLVLRARANVDYALRDNCDAVAAKGGNDNNLFQFLAGAYVGGGLFVANNLQIKASGGGTAIDILPTATGDTLTNAGGQTPTPAAGRTHAVELSNTVDFGDRSLNTAVDGFYHMVITYTIVAGAA